jgi:hypothetical protein
VQGGGGVSARSRKCGEVGGLGFGLFRNLYIDRTMPTIAMSRTGYITICLNSKYSYMRYPMD